MPISVETLVEKAPLRQVFWFQRTSAVVKMCIVADDAGQKMSSGVYII